MAYNDKKIIQVLFDAVSKIDDRYVGYRDDLRTLLADVIEIENAHMVAKTNVVQKIADQVNTAGSLLYNKQARD